VLLQVRWHLQAGRMFRRRLALHKLNPSALAISDAVDLA